MSTAVVSFALVVSACTPGEQADPAPSTVPPDSGEVTASPSPEPTSSPSPTLRPVKGQRVQRAVNISNGPALGLGERTKPRDGAADAARKRVGDWLDRHLDRLQRTGAGLLGDVAPRGVAPRDTRAPVTTRLASPDRPVASARYVLTAYHEGGVHMVTAAVVVRHPGRGDVSRAHFVFTIGRSGRPTLALFGPGAPAEGVVMRRGVTLTVLVVMHVLVLAAASLAAIERWGGFSLDGDEYVLLVMGSDQGPYRSGDVFDGRVDAIQLVVVDRRQEQVAIVSIPRDSYVPVRGRGTDKINTMLLGGPDAAVGTIEDLTGLDVDDWMVTSFRGLIDGINAFGGVTVAVERNLTNTGNANVNIAAGRQDLDGEEALGYARDRKSRPGGDFGRSGAQGDLLRALHRNLLDRADSPIALAAYVSRLHAQTESSISVRGLLRLGHTARGIRPADVTQVTLPGSVGTAGSASVVYLGGGAQAVFADLRDDARLNDS